MRIVRGGVQGVIGTKTSRIPSVANKLFLFATLKNLFSGTYLYYEPILIFETLLVEQKFMKTEVFVYKRELGRAKRMNKIL